MNELSINPILLIAMAAVAIIITVFMMSFGTASDRRLRKRMDQVLLLEGPSTGTMNMRGPVGAPELASLKAGGKQTRAKSIDDKLKKFAPNVSVVRLRLERAGLEITVTTLMLIALAIGVAFAALMWGYVGQGPLTSMIAGLAMGISLPALFISIRGKKRSKAFLADLPDTIDLIVRSVKSGLPVTEAIHAIARDMDGPAATEFKKVSDQMRIGISMDDALDKSVQRLGLTDYAFLAVSLSITRRTGGNLSETLANLSRLLRQRQQMHMKIRALSSEARASALIIGLLPFAVMAALLVLNPDYISTLFREPQGQDVLLFGGIAMTMGFGIMAKLVRFDF